MVTAAITFARTSIGHTCWPDLAKIFLMLLVEDADTLLIDCELQNRINRCFDCFRKFPPWRNRLEALAADVCTVDGHRVRSHVVQICKTLNCLMLWRKWCVSKTPVYQHEKVKRMAHSEIDKTSLHYTFYKIILFSQISNIIIYGRIWAVNMLETFRIVAPKSGHYLSADDQSLRQIFSLPFSSVSRRFIHARARRS